MSAPELGPVRSRAGVAGAIAYTIDVTYPGEEPKTVTFTGSVYDGPVVMITPDGSQVYVTEPSRFGSFSAEWVRRFFA